MKSANKHVIGLLICMAVFVAAGLGVTRPAAPDRPPYLSFSADVDGTKAWRELLSRKQARVKEWRLDWEKLPAGSGSALVAVEPDALSDEDLEAATRWVEQGNDLLLFAEQPVNGLADWLQTDSEAAPESDMEPELDSGSGSGTSGQIAKKDTEQGIVPIYSGEGASGEGSGYTGLVTTTARLLPIDGAEALLRDAYGVLASRIPLGDGSVTVVLLPQWLTNSQLAEHSHFELVWPLFAKSSATVWIDERHHGFAASERPGLLAVYPAWLVLPSALLALALLLWLWQQGKRFGPVHTPRAWTVRRGDETLLAVARWYERLGSREEALAHYQQQLRRLLAERWGLSLTASPEQAAHAAQARWPKPRVERLVRLLQEPLPGGGSQEAAPPKRRRIAARAFVERARELGEIIAYLEKE
ncbi:DUF4350 domain-containing protein [Paenibacillus athensensis]|uniref:DUF4350 domain-containing protein n=1 Tax=Paenibacillus athensensis TaxID=1967502 RepID=A0A4Y8Q070_9BACL|nr:DUF4350 domain-containing protein [Paenibacillus athensensis]MCD1261110.1 DUF4350 domain-containing protein [Paenibacillus athensensis]